MVLKNLEIVNLRNYEYVRLDFSNKINIFYGKNAQGKTNLLEAIYFLGITKSHRTSFDVELLMENKDFFRVNGLIENEYNYNLQIDYVKNRKKCFIDGKKTLLPSTPFFVRLYFKISSLILSSDVPISKSSKLFM